MKKNKLKENIQINEESFIYKRRKGILFLLSSLFVLTIVGTVSSTFAWYQYATKAGVAFEGTVVGEGENIEMGVFSPNELKDYEKFNFIKDPEIENLYWHQGDFTTKVINYYAKSNGYSVDTIAPTTSGSYNTNDDFSLKRAPRKLLPYSANDLAETRDYLSLQLAFRARAPKGTVFNENLKIVLKDASIVGKGSINDTARVHFNFGPDNQFILNPNEKKPGEDIVGGRLDLDQDGYYDFDETNKEFLYGEAESVKYLPAKPTDDGPQMIDDSSFTANTIENVEALDVKNSVFKKANYLGTEDVLNKKVLSYSSFSKESAKTYIKTATITFYLEGWDLACVDNELFNDVKLSLKFGIFEESDKK